MGIITVTLDDEVEKKLRNFAKGKGALGKTLSQAAKNWLEEQEQDKIKQKFLSIIKKGYPMGKIQYKKREELYDR